MVAMVCSVDAYSARASWASPTPTATAAPSATTPARAAPPAIAPTLPSALPSEPSPLLASSLSWTKQF
jgi:hypothetical protein